MKPSIGRIVHYVIPSGPHKGAHRPAIITAVYDEHVNLSIFTDQDDDTSPLGASAFGHLIRGITVRPGKTNDEINTWHWPERES